MKRVYIPMPDAEARAALLKGLLRGQPTALSRFDLSRVVQATELYSGSDLAALCREAAIIPIRWVLRDLPCGPVRALPSCPRFRSDGHMCPSAQALSALWSGCKQQCICTVQ